MIDLSELNRLEADLRGAGARAAIATVAVMHRGANNIVRDARQFAPKGPVARHYPATITYDVTVHGRSIEAEVGPDKDLPQGPLGNIFEYGTSHTAPQAHLGPALDREAPNVAEHLAEAAGRAVLP